MKVAQTAIEGCLLVTPDVFGDARGSFQELFHAGRYADEGVPNSYVQDNFSTSSRGILRGLHFQTRHAQGKLVQVLHGRVFDVCVDIRPDSPTRGQVVTVTLDAAEPRQFYLPPGCAHGFYVLSERAHFFYKCSDFYDASSEKTLLWNDPKLGIDWPLEGEPTLSAKDKQGLTYDEIVADS
ncbi:MAG: dTDP-4-dehydrorhamnose 3,5-epimerase [Planctomycetota bacterium]